MRVATRTEGVGGGVALEAGGAAGEGWSAVVELMRRGDGVQGLGLAGAGNGAWHAGFHGACSRVQGFKGSLRTGRPAAVA